MMDSATPKPENIPPTLLHLRKRQDFITLTQEGDKAIRPGFILLARHRCQEADAPVRIGFTVSRRVGNAVMRNRAKRRLRALADQVMRQEARALPGWDYVLIGRRDTSISRPFDAMLLDLRHAIPSRHRRKHPKTRMSKSRTTRSTGTSTPPDDRQTATQPLNSPS